MPSPLAEVVSRHTPPLAAGAGTLTGYPTPIEALTLWRAEAPTAMTPAFYQPSLCAVVQGAKRIAVGDVVLSYAPGQCLVAALDVPVDGAVTEASAAQPYLALELALDPVVLADVARHRPSPALGASGAGPSVFVGALQGEAAGALGRLVGLVDRPEAIPALYEPLARELTYALLTGPDGDAFVRLALPGEPVRRVARAIAAMKAAFPGPVQVGDLARAVGMSPSAFNAAFRVATGRSPLQFYKRLRLVEARRRLAAGGASAKSVAYEVGYASPSQFSREYARTFGAPPGRDNASALERPA